MLLVDCPGHGGAVLIWTSGIDQVRNTSMGIEVDYHCTCGHRGVWRPAGAAPPAAPAAAAAPPATPASAPPAARAASVSP